MSEALFRVVYMSNFKISGGSDQQTAEIERILEVSARNNAEAGVTGALLFNRGCFAQVLEGPREAVERIFERIAYDDRHANVTVLHVTDVARREFPEWSMKYAGRTENDQLSLAALAAAPMEGAMAVLDMLKALCRREDRTDG